MRGVVYYEDSDGYVKNACAKGASATSCPAAAENNFVPNGAKDSGHETLNFRLHAAWDLSEDTSVLASFHYTDEEQGTDENVPSGVLDLDSIDSFGLAQALDPGTGFYPRNQNRLSHDINEFTDNESTVGVLNITHHINSTTTLKSITGFIDASWIETSITTWLVAQIPCSGSTPTRASHGVPSCAWRSTKRTMALL